jgi:hypothetical protein
LGYESWRMIVSNRTPRNAYVITANNVDISRDDPTEMVEVGNIPSKGERRGWVVS